MKKTLLIALALMAFAQGYSQQLWETVTRSDIRGPVAERVSLPVTSQLYQLNKEALAAALANAPLRGTGAQGIIISLPNADGMLQDFRVFKAPVIAPGLEAKYPAIQSYIGQAVAKPSTIVRFSMTLYGLHAMTLTADEGTHYIDPYTKDGSYYMVYKKSDLQKPARPFQCLTADLPHGAAQPKSNTPPPPPDMGNFRTYRLAVVATVEYSAFHIAAAGLEGGTPEEKTEAVIAAIAVTMTRVNSMFERDLSVTLQLIENNDEIVFIDSDELNNDDAGALLEEGNAVMYDVIGADNFDMGHSFGTGGGGLAAGAPCSDFKGGAMTGIGSPVGDPFDIDYVAHEMGHQFGAGHTFNAECGGNRSDELAFEPGGGTTILAYAGVCDPVIQWSSDAQFHAISIQQMRDRINSESDCVPLVSTGNTPPLSDAGSDYTIPKGTAFILEGSATDANADALTYDWEQMNNEISVQPPVADAVGGPNFRSLPITESPNRWMPRIEDVLGNNLAPQWEVVPTVGREMDFALTVRDNSILGGESHTDYMHITVADAAGPFVITSPNSFVEWEAASNKNVIWDVAGTTGNGVDTPYVDIYLSTDGGFTYPVLLAEKVPNDGSETIMVPNNSGSQNRLMVKGHDNIFYDISNADFSITETGPTFAATVNGSRNVDACLGNDALYQFTYSELNGFNGTTTFALTGNPEGTFATFTPAAASANGLIQLMVSTGDTAPGFYSMAVTMTSGDVVKTIPVYLNVLSAEFNELALLSPADMDNTLPVMATLTWNADTNATFYEVQVATDSDFTDVVSETVTADVSYAVTGLEESTLYYWRVRPLNEACTGDFTETRRFATGENFCTSYASGEVPVEIPGDAEATVSSSLSVTDDYIVQDAQVTLDISHTWITDITVRLISPSGTEVVLFSETCGDWDDANATFDDSGTALSCSDTPPAISGIVLPETALAQLNGQPANGIWILEVFDTEPWDGGSINSWSLELCGITPTVEILGTGVVAAKPDFVVFPNPNTGSFTIQFDSVDSGPVHLSVYDMRGRRIYEKSATSQGGLFSETISLSAEAGIYMVDVEQNGKKKSKKIVIK